MANHNARICAPVLGIAEAPSAAPIGGSARDAHVPRLITEREFLGSGRSAPAADRGGRCRADCSATQPTPPARHR
jgi:hypothetical protein